MQIFFLLILLCSFLTSGCQKSLEKETKLPIQKQAVIRFNIKDDPATLDPRKARDTVSITLMKMFFEGLTRINAQEEAELALAEKVEISDDLKTYTFHLKPTTWSNGDPLTASDFIYAWKNTLDPKLAYDNAYQLYVIKNAKEIKAGKLSPDTLGASAVDALTLKIELEQPTPYLMQLLSFPIFFPISQKIDELGSGWTLDTNLYVGNGPFMPSEWKHKDENLPIKNLKYWDVDQVKLTQIHMMMVSEETEMKLFEQKQLDWAGSPLSTLSLDAIAALKQQGVLQIKPILGTYFLRANTHKSPFDHVLIRKAFALAINRKDIVEHITQGNQLPAKSLVPPSLNLENISTIRDGAIEDARLLFQRALREAQMALEHLPKITLTYPASERNHRIAQALQQQWFSTFHVPIKLEALESKVYFERLSKQDYMLAAGSWLADYIDPMSFLEVFKHKSSSTNNTEWENERYMHLLDESAKIVDSPLRSKVLGQSEKILMEAMPIIPVYHYTMLYLKNDALKSVVFTSLGSIDFKWAYLDNDIIAGSKAP